MKIPEAVQKALRDPQFKAAYESAPPEYKAAFAWRLSWMNTAHKYQVLPTGEWDIWLLLAGRGAGKTRTAAEQLGWWAWSNPKTRWLVAAPTSSDVRATCFEGDSGLMSVIPQILVKDYNKALHEIVLTNGTLIKGIPASEPERFRGPQFHGAWCCTADTLILMADGTTKQIIDISAGETVMTRHGARKVLFSGKSGNPNDLVSIECGVTRLTVTVDHPILIGNQWVAAGDIKTGDRLWVDTSTSWADMLTESCTSNITERYQKDGLSTTKTKTSRTIIQTILSLCHGQSIRLSTLLEKQRLTCRSVQRLARWKNSVSQKLRNALTASLNLFQQQLAGHDGFAAAPAWRSGDAIDSLRSKDPAMSAKVNTSQLNDSRCTVQSSAMHDQKSAHIEMEQIEVLSVARLPNTETFNLTVDGEHEFIANGIVVHNCDELAAWEYLQEAWDMMMFGIRLGSQTKIIASTTPKPKDLIIDLISRDGDDVVITSASTYENLDNLSTNFRKQILQYEGTKLGRQEIYAEIIDPEEGGIVKREWFKLFPANREIPKLEFVLQSYDCATSEKTQNDPTAQITMGVFKPMDGPMSVLILDCWNERLQYPDLRPKVIEEYKTSYGEEKAGKRVDLILIEDKSAGISLIQDLQRAHLPVRAYNPGRADKIQRLSIVANIIMSGRVWIPESMAKKGYVRDWAEGMVSQVCSFPEAVHDDYVDCLSQGLRYLRDAGFLDIDPSPHYDDDYYADDTQPKKVNPYAA